MGKSRRALRPIGVSSEQLENFQGETSSDPEELPRWVCRVALRLGRVVAGNAAGFDKLVVGSNDARARGPLKGVAQRARHSFGR